MSVVHRAECGEEIDHKPLPERDAGQGNGQPLPRHIGIIMDGNGRWARKRGLPRTAGHRAGVETARRVVRTCAELGVGVLTLYAFSTENWARPRAEVSFLMRLCEEYATTQVAELRKKGVRLQFLGRRQGLPPSLLRAIDNAVHQTEVGDRLTLNLAFNYGGRAEIIDAVQAVVRACQQGQLDPATLDDAVFSRYLYTRGSPNPDLIIRTAGEARLSNFLIWQAAEASFWTTPVFWPDFHKEHLLEAIEFWRRSIG